MSTTMFSDSSGVQQPKREQDGGTRQQQWCSTWVLGATRDYKDEVELQIERPQTFNVGP